MIGLAAVAFASHQVTLVTLDGEEIVIDPDRAGDPLVVHFWATWCPACVDELPQLDRLVRERCSGRVRVIAVNLAESEEVIARSVREWDLSLEVARDPDGGVFRQLAGGSTPANYVRSPDGVSRSEGAMTMGEWAELLGRLGCANGTDGPRSSKLEWALR